MVKIGGEKMKIVMKVKEYREKVDMKQIALARAAGTNQGFISEVEEGNKFPSLSMLCRLAKVLGCSAHDLFDCVE